MPAVLTTASTLRCVHGGTVTVPPSQTLLTVAGKPVLVQSDLVNAVVAGCPNSNPSASQTPCLKITSLTTGASVTLSVAGRPVLLATARGLTNATPPQPVMWQVTAAGQTVLEAT
jgi:hypothetical protein